MNNLGLAFRAQKLQYGTSNVIKSIQRKEAKLVIVAQDASDNTKKKIKDKCTYYNVDYIIKYPSSELSKAIGKRNIMVISILDSGFKNIL